MENGIYGLGAVKRLSLKWESTGRKVAVTLPLDIEAMFSSATVAARNAWYPRFGDLLLTLIYETISTLPPLFLLQ